MSSWAEIKDGFGLEKIPADKCKDICCQHCDEKRHLYTTASVVYDGSRRGYDKMMTTLRSTALCRTHAIWLYS